MKLFVYFLLMFVSFCVSERPKNCTKPGLFCETCSNLVACVQNDDETWTKDTVATCTSPKRCVRGKCTTDFDVFCSGLADLDFPCRKVGIFPHPFYCNKFVLCVKDYNFRAYLNECEQGFGFNGRTDICDVPLEDGLCPEGVFPVPVCNTWGQSEALPENPAKYYVCEEYSSSTKMLYPVINVCPPGEIYDDFQCSKRFSTSTFTTPSTTLSSKSSL
ncbi:uncharacterized protein LOC123003783 [Tribolium madens]|uniref:uncharacterized protein LOC123003783 n=1 Tax=Tribolium madens TaxID=41895 RepID=UPI001CF7277F|nr:uncharacterized protein LOC123003783 [Tribolium madens]